MKINDPNRPRCINYNCNYVCAVLSKRKDGNRDYRALCGGCHKARYNKKAHQKMLDRGVKPFLTGKCSNQNSRLGFCCPIDYEKAEWAIGFTEHDHIDGNSYNNVKENVQELCALCHREKGKRSGDYIKS